MRWGPQQNKSRQPADIGEILPLFVLAYLIQRAFFTTFDAVNLIALDRGDCGKNDNLRHSVQNTFENH